MRHDGFLVLEENGLENQKLTGNGWMDREREEEEEKEDGWLCRTGVCVCVCLQRQARGTGVEEWRKWDERVGVMGGLAVQELAN